MTVFLLYRENTKLWIKPMFLFPLIIVCFSFDIDYSFRAIANSFWTSNGWNFSCFVLFS